MNEIIIFLIAFVLSIIAGFIISYMTRDELVDGRKWFSWITIICLLTSIWSYLTKDFVVLYSMMFLTIVSLISYIKSFNDRFVKKK